KPSFVVPRSWPGLSADSVTKSVSHQSNQPTHDFQPSGIFNGVGAVADFFNTSEGAGALLS
ncbi:MAG TPA: hypothetical protein VGP62_06800, partial [Bryobacteraceae bacterium]|nr:hypothetical protein [Bryobacteraceae bacterium]